MSGQYQVIPLQDVSFLDFFWWYLGFGGGKKFETSCSTAGGVFNTASFECRKTIPQDIIAARAAAVTEIQNMEYLTAAQKSSAIAAINASVSLTDIANIKTTNATNNAQLTSASALNAEKANAVANINELTNLSSTQRSEFNTRINAATTSAVITAIKTEATNANQQLAASVSLLTNACTRAGFASNCKFTDLDRLAYECNHFGITSTTACTKNAVIEKEKANWQMAIQTPLPSGVTACPSPKTLLPRSKTCIEMTPPTPAAQRSMYNNTSAFIVMNSYPVDQHGGCSASQISSGNFVNNYNNTGCHTCPSGYILRGTQCFKKSIIDDYDSLPQPSNVTSLVEPFRNTPKNEFMQRPRIPPMQENFRNPPKFNQALSKFNKNTMSAMDSSGTFCASVNF